MQEFSRCKNCGIIFHNPAGKHSVCTKCREESGQPESEQDELRLLKNVLRDMRARGEYLTVTELSAETEVPEERIWRYIRSGEIDTATLDDPKVRNYLARKRHQQMKAVQRHREGQKPQPEEPSSPKAGFHHKLDDDERH